MKDIGNGLSLVSIQNLHLTDDHLQKSNCILPKQDLSKEKLLVPFKQDKQTDSFPIEKYETTQEEQMLFDKICDNRMRIEMQHQHLMFKAAQLLSFSSIQNHMLNN